MPINECSDAKELADPSSLIPGAFPITPPLAPPYERPDDDIPTEQLEQLEIEIPTTFEPLELRTELGSHLHPKRPSYTPSPKRTLPPRSAPAKAIPKPGLQDDVDIIEDPWMRKSLAYNDHPFGRPVSAVRLFAGEKKPLPPNRLASIFAPEWEKREKQKRELERDQLRPARIRPQGPAVRNPPDEWLKRVYNATKSPGGPVARSPSGDDLYPRDIATCFNKLSWLNDEIINSYLTILVQYLRQSNQNTANEKPRFHAFNTFFYTTLRDKGYQGVRRWANRAKIGGEGLLDVKTVFIPVHESSHWTLLVVRPADRAIEYFDSLDRLGRQGSRQVKNIKEWLRGELGAKYDEDEWNVLKSISSQQDNGSDCGVFLLTNAKAIALDIEPTAFGPADTQNLRTKIVAELMNGGLHGDFCPTDRLGNTLL